MRNSSAIEVTPVRSVCGQMLHVLMTVCVAPAPSPNTECRTVEVKFNAIKGLEAIRFRPSGLVDRCIENRLSYSGAFWLFISSQPLCIRIFFNTFSV